MFKDKKILPTKYLSTLTSSTKACDLSQKKATQICIWYVFIQILALYAERGFSLWMQSFTHADLDGEFMGVKLPACSHADCQAVLFIGIKYELVYQNLGKYLYFHSYVKAHVHWKHTKCLHLFIFYGILFVLKFED